MSPLATWKLRRSVCAFALALSLAFPAAASADNDQGGDNKAAALAAAQTDASTEATPVSPGDAPRAEASAEASIDPALAAEIDRMVEARLKAALAREIDRRVENKLAEAQSAKPAGTAAGPVSLAWRGDFFTKMLVRNNQSGGCLTYGNPAPEGDNFAGDNGMCSELGLTVIGRVSDYAEAGARIQSRYGAQWANWWENGDLKAQPDGSGESLGMNHASYMQLRGIYLRVAPPIPTVRSVHIGASDLSMFNPWTIGKIRFIERDNARGIFVDGSFGDWLSYTGARIALPKLFASANYNTGIDDPYVTNPFWERDEAWGLKLRSDVGWGQWEAVGSWVRDFEADIDDPDAIGSSNQIDSKDGVVITIPRYQNINATLQFETSAIDGFGFKTLAGYSWSQTNPDLVFNAVSGSQGFSPVPMGEHHGYAVVSRGQFYDPFDADLAVSFEYFNIGRDWVSVFGARREQDLLLTDGFMDGQVATLNVANEFIDFNDSFYEPIIGWHGATTLFQWTPGDLEGSAEFTFIEYNTDTGDSKLDTDTVYPDFLFTDGMTDTEFYSYANTNDRGRDPRSVYKKNQNRNTMIGVLKGSYNLDIWNGITLRAKQKTIVDSDVRDLSEPDDDYRGYLFFNRISAESSITDELSLGLGYQFDYWIESKRSGEVIAGVADYPDYTTVRQKAFLDMRYVFAGVNLWYHLEYLNKDVDTTDPQLNFGYQHVVRSLAMLSASF